MQNAQGSVPVVYRPHPFMADRIMETMAEGLTVAEIVERMPELPLDFAEFGMVVISGDPVPREMWRYVRPKPDRPDRPIIVNLVVNLQVGGSSGGVWRTVAAVAIVVAAAVISAGALGPAGFGLLGPAFAAGQTGAVLLSAGVAHGGGLARGALA
jgi:hypothetical protein